MNHQQLTIMTAIFTLMFLLFNQSADCAKIGEPQVYMQNGIAVIRNTQCRLEVDAKTGEIKSLTPGTATLRGKWFEVVKESRNGMEPWETWKHGTDSPFTAGVSSIITGILKNSAYIHLEWLTHNGVSVKGEIKLRTADKGPLFQLNVSNVDGTSLVDTIRLPVLKGISLDNADNDWFSYPHTLGTRFRVNGFKLGEKLEDPYPGFMYMQWLDLYDDKSGIYLGCLDDYGYSKSLFIGRDDDGKSLMGVSFTGCWIAKKGDSWTTPWVQIVSHKGDWHAGADIYREFAQKAFGPINLPERVKEMPTTQCWLAHQASNGDVGKLFEIQQQAPIRTSYLTKSLNTSTPEGWDGFHGSALEYKDAFKKIRELGGSPALFTFDRAPLMGKPNYADYFTKWVCMGRDGSFEVAFKDMMPSPFDADFTRARVGEAVRWVRDMGVDEIHYDTEGTCGYTGVVGTGMISGPSYNMKFKQRPNEIPHYFKKLYQETLAECRKYNPNFILRAEHCADFFYPEFSTSTAHFWETSTGSMLLTHNPPHDSQLMPMLFDYTLPQHAVTQMPSVSSSDFWMYGYGMGHGFHGGGPSWCFNPGVRDAESPSGELLHRYRFYDDEWREYYDFRVGFEEAVVDGRKSDTNIQAFVNGKWEKCEFPGPVIVVTHIGGGREVTLGRWYGGGTLSPFSKNYIVNEDKPSTIEMHIPTSLKNPNVRVYGKTGLIKCKPIIKDGMIDVDIPEPDCFAIEVFNGPEITLGLPQLAEPGKSTSISVTVNQVKSEAGKITFILPTGWNPVKSIEIPAEKSFKAVITVNIPDGIFGRNYPIKAIYTSKSLKRTVAAHLKVMEPLTVLYSFDIPDAPATNCVDPGKPAQFTIKCINNTPGTAKIGISVVGEGISANETYCVNGMKSSDIGNVGSKLNQWIELGAKAPDNVLVKTIEYVCLGIPSKPIQIRVTMNDKQLFKTDAYPRTRIMDLNGEWKMNVTPPGRTNAGGYEGLDALDMQSLTPDIWDGKWKSITTPFDLKNPAANTSPWATYRRLVYIPAEWQGADIWMRLNVMGTGWGKGTMSMIYVNGWPAGRVGQSGDKQLSELLNYGGWNLIAVASYMPDVFRDPYLFVRNAPIPSRIKPYDALPRPVGAFLLMNRRPSGQGLTRPFLQGAPDGDHIRTERALGSEWQFIYFAISDEFMKEPGAPVEVEIEYLDKGTDMVGLDYDSTDPSAPINGAFKSAPGIKKTNTGQWKTAVFRLDDAKFANREHMGSDFRIYGSKEDLHVRRVEVRLASK